MQAFSDRIAEFRELGAKVAAASVDSKHTHLAWINTPRSKGGLGKMDIPILADLSKSLSKNYGVLIEDPADGDCGVSYRATFIIDPSGTVRSVSVNDLPVGRSVDEVLRLVKAFQYVEKHGEVCPAGWKPGDKTMIADPKKSKEYFSAVHKD
jgi:alkyl hydroperoxide reductase subunit AhpC